MRAMNMLLSCFFLLVAVSEASAKSFNVPDGLKGVWGNSPRACMQYLDQIASPRFLDRALPRPPGFPIEEEDRLHMLFAGQLRSYAEGEAWCDFNGFRQTRSGAEFDVSCTNTINPDRSTGTLVISGHPPHAVFRWYGQFWDGEAEPRTRCMTLSDLSSHFAGAWQLDRSQCSASVRVADYDLVFSRRGSNLDLTLLDRGGKLGRKDALSVVVFVDDMEPLEVRADLRPGEASIPLGGFTGIARELSASMFLSVWDLNMAQNPAGSFRVPLFEVPLFGSTRAMDFLSDCR